MAPTHPRGEHDRGHGLFSSAELRRLMRVEFERARRYGYELACLCLAVDRLGPLQDLYGTDATARLEEELRAGIDRATRGDDFPRGWVDDVLVVLVPHTSPALAATIAQRLLDPARRLELWSDGRRLSISISIGLSGNRDAGVVGADALFQRARAGLAIARANGGGRCMRGEEVPAEVERLRRELEELRAALGRDRSADGRPVGGALEAALLNGDASLLERPEDRLLAARIESIFEASGMNGAAGAELKRQLIRTALAGVHAERQRGDELDRLRRRVAKLTETLSVTEAELRRVAALKDVDAGVASVYRTVQGLSLDAADAKERVNMLTRIFEANVELRRGLRTSGN